MNNSPQPRLHWKHKAKEKPPSPMEPQEVMSVVKGTTHRIIVVKSPDKRYFKEAIFVVRDDILRENGADNAAILGEAYKIADSYMGRFRRIRGTRPKTSFISRLPAPLIAAAGAAGAGAVWLTARLCGL